MSKQKPAKALCPTCLGTTVEQSPNPHDPGAGDCFTCKWNPNFFQFKDISDWAEYLRCLPQDAKDEMRKPGRLVLERGL
jgi:hypothetical protein